MNINTKISRIIEMASEYKKAECSEIPLDSLVIAFAVAATPADLARANDASADGEVLSRLIDALPKLKGRAMTCAQVWESIYGSRPTMRELRKIGGALKSLGYQMRRGDGKKLYDL